MAPEQMRGKAGTIGPAADIYALGTLLYEILTGRPPFRAETAAETERQVIHDEPVSPARLNCNPPFGHSRRSAGRPAALPLPSPPRGRISADHAGLSDVG
jgi:serine/threonine protein kinase